MPTLTGGRHVVVKVRLSDSEHDEIRRRATAAGMSVQRFLFEAAMDGSAAQSAERRRAQGDAQRARLVLTSIANNVNQLAKWSNTNHVLPDTFAVALDDVRRATAEVAETYRRLGSSFEEPR
jgi:Bacterial mobilisation protein (MobC)